MKQSQITSWCHEIMKSQMREGGIYIDATMGNGQDTEFFCKMAGETGKVLAFDVQDAAVEKTRIRLAQEGLSERATLILDGHEHMDRYAQEGSVDGICFNFGYLPGGDHSIATIPETSIEAIEKGLRLLNDEGMMSLCIYSGGDTGFDEKNQILAFLAKLPAGEYTVILNEYYNKENHPPMPVFIFKSKRKREK